jgi:hypothetical protein
MPRKALKNKALIGLLENCSKKLNFNKINDLAYLEMLRL